MSTWEQIEQTVKDAVDQGDFPSGGHWDRRPGENLCLRGLWKYKYYGG